MNAFKLLFTLFFITLFSNCTSKLPKKIDNSIETLKILSNYMTGDFSSVNQSLRDTDYFNINLHVRPIWQKQYPNEFWLYVEQASASARDKPYRQRIYQLKAVDELNFTSTIYEIDNPKDFIKAYQNTSLFDNISTQNLVLREGCTVFLKLDSDKNFVGSTNSNDCLSSLRGATYATTKVTIKPDKMLSWDQGFDANGKQVWGATKGGYIFDKTVNK